MWLPIVFRDWKQLDEWDAALCFGAFTVGGGGALALGFSTSVGVWTSFILTSGAFEVRRMLDPGLAVREVTSEPRSSSLFGPLLVAFGIFGMFIALASGLLAFAMIADRGKLPIAYGLGTVGFSVFCAAVSVAVIGFARRRRVHR
jgi:hypothetical protein